jgi:peptidoglycan/xylan/chitin deacetylase (PgdA/CDA1 family)
VWVPGFVALAILASCASQGRVDEVPRGETTEPLIANNMLLGGTSLAAKQIALTFDDGPGPRTGELSTYLKNQGIAAVFFMNGRHLATPLPPLTNNADVVANPTGLMAQIKADGHLIGNHSTTHGDLTIQIGQPNGTAVVYEELLQTDNSIKAYVPPRTFLFRAPYGYWNQADFDAVKATPLNKYIGPIFWEVGGTAHGYPNAGADWACWQGQLYNTNGTLANGTGYATTVQCSDAYIAEINSMGKGIVLMHDPYSWAQGSTVDMVKDMVPKLKAQGYTFVRVDKIPQILTALGCDTSCATCSGTQADECLTCKPNAYLAGGTCVPCTVCAATEYTKVACTATANTVCDTCSTCAAGTFQETACTATANTVCTKCDATCATCSGPLATDCTTCPTGNYKSATGCVPCSTCKPGTVQTAACGPTKDTVCTACDPTCVTCSGPLPTDCNACVAGSYKSATGCLACSKCKPGTTQTAACGPASDTVCTACPPGTNSDGTGPCTPVASDAGPGKPDASSGGDAGGSVDAGSPEPPPGDGCNAGGSAPSSSFAGAALALAFVLGRRRVRRSGAAS